LLVLAFALLVVIPGTVSALSRPAGDVNDNCGVDIMDLAKVGLCYGCGCGQQCWEGCERADVRPDCIISIFDLATVGLGYGGRCRIFGLDFSPYINGQKPPDPVTEAQIRERLGIVAPYAQWVRSYAATNGLERIPYAAKDMGLKVAMGTWIDNVDVTNDQEIANMIAAAGDGMVDIAVVGNEVIQGRFTSKDKLVYNINKVKQELQSRNLSHIPVTTPEAYEFLFRRNASTRKRDKRHDSHKSSYREHERPHPHIAPLLLRITMAAIRRSDGNVFLDTFLTILKLHF